MVDDGTVQGRPSAPTPGSRQRERWAELRRRENGTRLSEWRSLSPWLCGRNRGWPRAEAPSAQEARGGEKRPSRAWRSALRRGLTCLWSLPASPSAMWPRELPGGHRLPRSGVRGRGQSVKEPRTQAFSCRLKAWGPVPSLSSLDIRDSEVFITALHSDRKPLWTLRAHRGPHSGYQGLCRDPTQLTCLCRLMNFRGSPSAQGGS